MDRELIDAGQVGAAITVAALAAAVAAVALVVLNRGRRSAGLTKAALLLSAVVLLGPMWWVYNRIEDHFGLDSVAALLINVVLFCLLGAAVGLAFRQLWPADEDLKRTDTGSAELEES